MIVVVREEYTEKKELTRCMRQLSLSNVKVLGCVLNEASSGNGSYGKYKYKKYKHGYGYGYGYGYYKSHKDNDETDSKENDK
jgi:Mrp family chromosome partitioning ATPase